MKAFLAATAVASALAGMACANTDVTRATLGNGLKVVIVRDPLAPVATTEINYLVGSDEAPDGFPGTAHAMEHMMFRGSPGLTKDQLAAVAANLGGAFNADTTQSVTQYFFVAPAQNLNLPLRIEALRMRALDSSDEAWAKERGAIEQEVSRDLSSPDFKFYTELMARLFEGSPYAHTPLGTRESFDKTTAAAIRDFHDRWYAPNNAILVITGDVDPAATLAEVKAEFGDIPRKAIPARPAFNFKLPEAKTIALPTDSPYGSVYIAYRWPGLKASDQAAAVVLSQALGSQRAPLFGMGMDGTALFGGFFGQSMPEAGVGFAVGIFPRGGNPQPIVQKMQSILADAVSKGIDPALVAAAKERAIADLEYNKNSVDGLAVAWSRALAFQGLDSPDAMRAALEAVTPEAVDALARRVFDPSHAVTAILTPQSSGAPVGGQGFGGAESFASNPDKPVVLPEWARGALSKLEVPPPTIHPISYTLANGLRLIVQPESVSDTVEVYGRVHTNQELQAAGGQDGVADVLEGLFTFGTTSLGRLQLQQALDAISAHEQAGPNFSLKVPAAHFAEGMKLLADNELHPALPAQAFAVVQQRIAGIVAGIVKSPEFLTNQGLNEALLPKGDAELRHATPESVAGLSLGAVKDYYAKAFRPDMTTIVIVGKVEPAAAKKVVDETFGAWSATGDKPDVDYAAVPSNPPGQLHVPDSSAVQDDVRMAETVDVTRDDPDRYALKLGNEVLGGGFYASWLYRDLRDKRGLVYTVSTNFELGKRRGAYKVNFGSDPDKAAPAAALVKQDVGQIQVGPISEEDLTRAKGILVRQIPLGESSFSSIAGRLLTYAEEGKPLDESTIAGKAYLKLTAQDVERSFKQHVRPDGFVTVVKGP